MRERWDKLESTKYLNNWSNLKHLYKVVYLPCTLSQFHIVQMKCGLVGLVDFIGITLSRFCCSPPTYCSAFENRRCSLEVKNCAILFSLETERPEIEGSTGITTNVTWLRIRKKTAHLTGYNEKILIISPTGKDPSKWKWGTYSTFELNAWIQKPVGISTDFANQYQLQLFCCSCHGHIFGLSFYGVKSVAKVSL